MVRSTVCFQLRSWNMHRTMFFYLNTIKRYSQNKKPDNGFTIFETLSCMVRNCVWLSLLLRQKFNCLKFLNIMYSRNNTIIMSGIVCILVFLVVPRFTEGNDLLFRHPQGYTNPIPAYPQPVAPHYNGGLHYGDLGCCRSSFPGMNKSYLTILTSNVFKDIWNRTINAWI